jgi:LPXTG-motif cell wall-anchored protein
MKLFTVIAGIVFVSGLFWLLRRKKSVKPPLQSGHTLEEAIQKQKEEEKAARLEKGLYYRIKSRLFR